MVRAVSPGEELSFIEDFQCWYGGWGKLDELVLVSSLFREGPRLYKRSGELLRKILVIKML